MPSKRHGGVSERSTPTDTSSSKNERTAKQAPISSLNAGNGPPTAGPADTTGPSRLAYPVCSCSSVFQGEMPHRYFWRHLKQPDLCGLSVVVMNQTDKVDIIECPEDNKAEEERELRTAEFESRAKSLGITEEKSIAEKLAIWEGMWAAEQAGNDIQYGARILLDAATNADQ
ncbi:hypothetical protein HOY80DRAFT_1036920 [Tuber brumale]|nr:hypothetical protein HOY80DRAFT_1036920 [Tuber brumale]